MERLDTTQFVLLLMDTPGIGPRSIGAMLRRSAVLRMEPHQILEMPAPRLVEEFGLRRQAADALTATWSLRLPGAAETARWLRRNGVSVLTVLDASYPAKLGDRLDDAPPALFLYGNAALLYAPLFAVANSNGSSEAALLAGDRAAEAAAEAGAALVTGHNRIQYQRPALAVRRSGGTICYVLDRGLIPGFGGDLTRALFPAARIWGPAYDPDRDLTVSPFGVRDHGIASNNRRRDSLIFALADLVFAGDLRAGGRMARECQAAGARGQHVYRVTQPDLLLPTAVPLDPCDRGAVMSTVAAAAADITAAPCASERPRGVPGA